MNEQERRAHDIGMQLALREMVRQLIALQLTNANPEITRQNLRAFEDSVVQKLQTIRFERANEPTTTLIRESAISAASNTIGSIEASDE